MVKQVALKCLVDNIATYAVEITLVQQLEHFLSPSYIIDMRPELIQRIAAESPSTVAQRKELSRKLDVLVIGLEVCTRGTRSMSIDCFVNSSGRHADAV